MPCYMKHFLSLGTPQRRKRVPRSTTFWRTGSTIRYTAAQTGLQIQTDGADLREGQDRNKEHDAQSQTGWDPPKVAKRQQWSLHAERRDCPEDHVGQGEGRGQGG